MSCIILVAENEVVVRNMVRLLLERDGHEVLVAIDGHEALELSRDYQGRIDLLLTDVAMPGMDGRSLVAQLTKERPGIKILIVSEKISASDLHEVRELPFLHKPFSPKEFREKIRQVLNAPPMQN